MHLGPDLATLTYGDQGRRARQIQTLNTEDLLVFYASLRDIKERHLVYGIIGIFVIEKIYKANDVPRELWNQNAHTRRIPGAVTLLFVLCQNSPVGLSDFCRLENIATEHIA